MKCTTWCFFVICILLSACGDKSSSIKDIDAAPSSTTPAPLTSTSPATSPVTPPVAPPVTPPATSPVTPPVTPPATSPVTPPVTPPAGTLKNWSDPVTWGGTVPKDGDDVTIPFGISVLLDQTSASLGVLNIDGDLVFANNKDIQLTAKEVYVSGSLRIETAFKAIIELTGFSTDPASNQSMGSKLLAVMSGGYLKMDGNDLTAWTQLSATVNSGDQQITVLDNNGWQVGDEIIITPTDFYNVDQPERFTITSINGNTIGLNQPVLTQKWGALQTYSNYSIDQRAEVANISRNIVVRGDTNTQGGYGGHMMVMQNGLAEIDHVEFLRMGQSGILARYPVHWHMANDASGNYVNGSSIHNSFNRCVTLHGTDNVLISNNVCYNIIGHAMFLEEAGETGNRFYDNIVVDVQPTSTTNKLVPFDDSIASGFWITNPDNEFRNNVAAYVRGHGFWYVLPTAPFGMSAGQPDIPNETNVKLFENNVAHSNEGDGLNLQGCPDTGIGPESFNCKKHFPKVVPGDSNSPHIRPIFTGTKAYKHLGHGIWNSSRGVFIESILADNIKAFSGNNGSTTLAPNDEKAKFEGGIMIGRTANSAPNTRSIFGLDIYDGRIYAEDTIFENYQHEGPHLGVAVQINSDDQNAVIRTDVLVNAQLINSNPLWYNGPFTDPAHGDLTPVHKDVDGSWSEPLVGSRAAAGQSLVGPYSFVLTNNCIDYLSIINGYLCDEQYNEVIFQQFNNTNADSALFNVRRIDNGVTYQGEQSWDTATAFIFGKSYEVIWTGVPINSLLLNLSNMTAGQSNILGIPWGNTVTLRTKFFNTGCLQPVATMSALNNSSGLDSYYYDGSKVWLKIENRQNQKITLLEMLSSSPASNGC